MGQKKPLNAPGSISSPLNSTNWLRIDNGIHYTVKLQPLNGKELCLIYGITRNTFKRWILPFKKVLGVRNGNYFSVLQVEIIFSKLGCPARIWEREPFN